MRRTATTVCARTGLHLVRSAGQTVWRVALETHGPLNPLRRPRTRPAGNFDEWKTWHRWDVPGHRTVYAATSTETAYSESLSWFRRRLSEETGPFDLSKYIDGVDTPEEAWAQVEAEWQNDNHIIPGLLPQAWRDDRRIYRLALPEDDGYFVNICHPESMAAIGQAMAAELSLLGVDHLDLSVLTGRNRELTCSVAEWIHGQILDDGRGPHGLMFPSRHGTGYAYGIWLRQVDEGKPMSTEPTAVLQSREIQREDPDLCRVLKRFGLRTH